MSVWVRYVILTIFVVLLTGTLTACTPDESTVKSLKYLETVMDQYALSYDVYTESGSAGNHFLTKAKMVDLGEGLKDPEALRMDEACKLEPNSKPTCIECVCQPAVGTWGGFYFMVGTLKGENRTPTLNWGKEDKAGVDLKGVTELTFWAKGAVGGEWVEFFCQGVGYTEDGRKKPNLHPDSARKSSTGYVKLTDKWQKYTIKLNPNTLDYVLGGFGWVARPDTKNKRAVKFYLDDIAYNKSTLDKPRFLISYNTTSSENQFDRVMNNVAFTYDNAVALMAFLAAGNYDRAKLIADAFVFAQKNDRFFSDGRIRNAYMGGDIQLPPGWEPYGKAGTARLPGSCHPITGEWCEDPAQVGTSTGNVAWAMLALIACYEKLGGNYLEAAKIMGNWVEKNCRDERGAGGYMAGFEPPDPRTIDPQQLASKPRELLLKKMMYKSTEHNIDLYAAFKRLHLITGDKVWLERAEHARKFVYEMWDTKEEKFWTGTGDDGKTINPDPIPVDVQAWALLSLREDGSKYRKAMDYAEKHHKAKEGYDFDTKIDGTWYEGTAQMAAAYFHLGEKTKSDTILSIITKAQFPTGAIPATDVKELDTGFYLSSGEKWLYYPRAHVGATAWYILAKTGVNPFWLFSKEK